MPMVLGHEAAGVIEETGPGVTQFARGDHVVAAFVPSCGHCKPRTTGRPALFGCAVITGVGAVVNTGAMPRGASVAVVGLGGVGLAALLAARMLEAPHLVAIDMNEGKLAVARALELAYRITARGGTTVSAGLSHPDQKFSIQHLNLVAEERTLEGSYLGSCVPSRDIPRYIDWYRAAQLGHCARTCFRAESSRRRAAVRVHAAHQRPLRRHPVPGTFHRACRHMDRRQAPRGRLRPRDPRAEGPVRSRAGSGPFESLVERIAAERGRAGLSAAACATGPRCRGNAGRCAIHP